MKGRKHRWHFQRRSRGMQANVWDTTEWGQCTLAGVSECCGEQCSKTVETKLEEVFRARLSNWKIVIVERKPLKDLELTVMWSDLCFKTKSVWQWLWNSAYRGFYEQYWSKVDCAQSTVPAPAWLGKGSWWNIACGRQESETLGSRPNSASKLGWIT